MKLIKNTGNDRVMDALHAGLTPAAKLDIATPAFSVFAFAEFAAQLQSLSACRLVLPDRSQTDLQLLGSDADRAFRNQLTARALARQCADWITQRVEVRQTQTALPQAKQSAAAQEPELLNSQSAVAKPQLPDLGFRVFKLASSNIQAWEPDRQNLAQTLEASVDHLKTDRTESDILFELLLKLGLDLTVPIETRTIAGQQVHSIGAGTLLVCLSKSITAKEVEPLALGIAAWHKTQAPAGESTIVFRDSAFADDVAKTNLTAILQQHDLENVRSL
jgi:hypothetical protein